MQLVRFLQKCANEHVTVELKNGTVVHGVLLSVDTSMNCHMKNVKVSVKGKTAVPMDNLTVRGNTVRYVVLPDSLALDPLLVSAAERK